MKTDIGSLLIMAGVLEYVITTLINRFIHHIPSKVAVPLYLIGIICIIVGFILNGKIG